MLFNFKDYIWIGWETFDDEGFVNGIREDAPDEIKEAYRKHKQRYQEWRNETKFD